MVDGDDDGGDDDDDDDGDDGDDGDDDDDDDDGDDKNDHDNDAGVANSGGLMQSLLALGQPPGMLKYVGYVPKLATKSNKFMVQLSWGKRLAINP